MQNLAWKRALIVALCALLLFLFACGRPPTTTTIVVTQVVTVESAGIVTTEVVRRTVEVTATPEPAAGPEAAEPVILDVGLVGDAPPFDPQLAADPDAHTLVENLFVGLTNLNPDTNQIEPELAHTWRTGDDGRTWTFELRDDIFWVRPGSSGEPGDARPAAAVVADDAVYTIRRACDPATEVPDAYLLYIIEGCERINRMEQATEADLATIGARALDETTLEISLVKPAAHFLTLTSLPLMRPLPRAEWPAMMEEMEEPAEMEELTTSGPFVLSLQSVAERRLVLHRNPHWPLPFAGNVETVNLLFLEDEDAAYEMWQENQFDVTYPPAGAIAALRQNDPEKLVLRPSQAVFYLGFNFDSGVLRIPEVRRALAAAIDPQQLVEELFDGAAVPLRHLTPPGVIGAPPPDEVGVGFSPSYAQQQMLASGFGDCRLMPPITFMVTGTDLSLRLAELLRSMWADVLHCNEEQFIIEQVQFGALLANTRADAGAQRPDMWELGWQSQYPDSHNWLGEVLHCQDSENRPRRPCSEVDNIIRRADTITDPAQRADLYRQAERLFFAEDGIQPIIPLYARGDYLLRQIWVTFTPASFGGEQYDRYNLDAEVKKFQRERS